MTVEQYRAQKAIDVLIGSCEIEIIVVDGAIKHIPRVLIGSCEIEIDKRVIDVTNQHTF